jgi:hypothetical protein
MQIEDTEKAVLPRFLEKGGIRRKGRGQNRDKRTVKDGKKIIRWRMSWKK